MKEADWYTRNDIHQLLNYLRNKVSERKMRLFAVACCREIDSLLPHEMCRAALTIAERMAEGEDVREEQWEIDSALYEMYVNSEIGQRTGVHYLQVPSRSESFDQEGATLLAVRWCMGTPSWNVPRFASGWVRQVVASNVVRTSAEPDLESVWNQATQEEAGRQIHLLRDVIGHPTHPSRTRLARLLKDVRLDPQVQRLAQAIYQDRDFAALPVLGDALEDAGCTVEEVLAHCRSDGKHVLGCWALDMLLGKE